MTRFENEANGLLITLAMLSCDAIVVSNNPPLSPPLPHSPPPPRKLVFFSTLSRKYFLVGRDGNLRINKKLRKGRVQKD